MFVLSEEYDFQNTMKHVEKLWQQHNAKWTNYNLVMVAIDQNTNSNFIHKSIGKIMGGVKICRKVALVPLVIQI